MVIVGEREQRKMKRSANLLHKIIHNSTLYVMKGYYHGELSINHASDYVSLFKDFIS